MGVYKDNNPESQRLNHSGIHSEQRALLLRLHFISWGLIKLRHRQRIDSKIFGVKREMEEETFRWPLAKIISGCGLEGAREWLSGGRRHSS